MTEVALSMLTVVPGGMGGCETYARALTKQLSTVTGVHAIAYFPVGADGLSQGILEVIVDHVKAGSSTADRLRAVANTRLHRSSIRRMMSSANVVHFPFTVAALRPVRTEAGLTRLPIRI